MAKINDDYAMQNYKKYTELTRKILSELPPFCSDFFRGVDSVTEPRTKYAYATDIKMFFDYLLESHPAFRGKKMSDIVVTDLDKVKPIDIEYFLEYVSLYERESTTGSIMLTANRDKAKARKIASLRSFYKYYYKREMIITTPAAMIDSPKLKQQPIVKLDPDEISSLLEGMASSEGMTDRQKKYHEKTIVRDTAIITLFLGTGIRISELVGIDMDDLNFISNEFSVIRKGGYRDELVFGSEVRSALLRYMEQREKIEALPGHENAFFLSLQRRRITVRAVENLVTKYASAYVPHKHITPHKLRSTFGTMLYNNTGDIYLVADVLGHKDVNTTRKHYADISKERRRLAAEIIKLNENDDNNTTE